MESLCSIQPGSVEWYGHAAEASAIQIPPNFKIFLPDFCVVTALMTHNYYSIEPSKSSLLGRSKKRHFIYHITSHHTMCFADLSSPYSQEMIHMPNFHYSVGGTIAGH